MVSCKAVLVKLVWNPRVKSVYAWLRRIDTRSHSSRNHVTAGINPLTVVPGQCQSIEDRDSIDMRQAREIRGIHEIDGCQSQMHELDGIENQKSEIDGLQKCKLDGIQRHELDSSVLMFMSSLDIATHE